MQKLLKAQPYPLLACLDTFVQHYSKEAGSAAVEFGEAFVNQVRGSHLWVVPVDSLVVVAGRMLTMLSVNYLWFVEHLAV